MVDSMLQPLQIQIVHNLVDPVAVCLSEGFKHNYVPSNVYKMIQRGIQVMKNIKHINGIYVGGRPTSSRYIGYLFKCLCHSTDDLREKEEKIFLGYVLLVLKWSFQSSLFPMLEFRSHHKVNFEILSLCL